MEDHVLHAQPAMMESKIKMRQELIALDLVLHAQPAMTESKIKMKRKLIVEDHVIHAHVNIIHIKF